MAMGEMHEMVMPFFTHMGMLEPLGSHSLNFSAHRSELHAKVQSATAKTTDLDSLSNLTFDGRYH